jgi:hypothetical protein
MSYMIKHPINAKSFKMATIYNNTDVTITAGAPKNTVIPLNTLAQTTGMGLTLATDQITLVEGKTYLIYYCVGIQNSTENRGGEVYIRKNGTVITSQPIVNAITNSSIIGASAWATPLTIASTSLTAAAGDTISFLYTRSIGATQIDYVVSASSKAFILEIG